jgi:CDP-glycerol glycerophosphotransferase (TagB/SpsB family)
MASAPLRNVLDAVQARGARIVVLALRAIYWLLNRLPRQNKLVLISRLYATTSQDFATLQAEITKQTPTTTVVVLNHRNTNPLRVPFQMLSEMYHLATARACITDSYIAAISVLRHKPGLIIIQIWHALGAIKRFGLAALDSAEGRPSRFARTMQMHRGYDWVIAGGPPMVLPFAECFGVPPERVLPIGTPRVDRLADPAARERRRHRIQAAHPEVGRRPVVLYAPTFRKGGEPVQVAPLLDALAPTDFDVVVALHPLDGRDFSTRPGVIQDAKITTPEWLAVADAVVTDYSSLVFDAAVAGVPLYFYVYDLDEYRERRGLFLDVDRDLPGPVERDAAALAKAIIDGAASREEVLRFRERFVAPADGGCARRIVQLALGARPEDLK